MRLRLVFPLLQLVLLCSALFAAEPYKKDTGPLAVDTMRYDWTDMQRQRKVPVKIYFPKTDAGPFPLIIFSHGLGGTRETYEYLGRHWASYGYVCAHVQHIGSDDSVWKNATERMRAMRGAAANLQNAFDRPLDVSFALDQMLKLHAEEGPFHKRLDTNAIGVAGHSFGAYTTLAVAGQIVGLTERTFRDQRVKAAIAMSSPVPRLARGKETAYSRIDIPILHMTGTEDNSPIGETSASERRIPFDHIKGPQYLVTFTGGDHMIFAGRWLSSVGAQKGPVLQSLILMSSTAFWDAYLKKDAAAKAWLADGDFEKMLDRNGRFEIKK